MQFLFHEQSGANNLLVDGELHKYLFKVRRFDTSKNLFFRNLQDSNIYEYKVLSSDRRKTHLEFVSHENKPVLPQNELHLGWCVVDPKTIEKSIASLNELGVTKITFIYCEYSQKQFKLNTEKLEKMLINSSQQSGRSSIIELDICESLENFLEQYPNSYMFNFSQNYIEDNKDDIKTIIIGCEGGFASAEVSSFDAEKIVGIKSNLILRSETAVITVSSKILV
ncbi:16S rRNA (uracil(1498)-N(3))-methyltransferase [Arcobacteraceae bacterium]|nr:16S rRNA (uracil(1498)-N(3))-methyltransferase [Arcobacteraceae bacterium]